MSKVIVIDSCGECPHFEGTPRGDDDNRYNAWCNNPQLDEPMLWSQKIGIHVEIPPACPLNDHESHGC
jgi:hypothetical protein